MARTRTAGITIDGKGCRTLNKEHLATRIFVRLGDVSQEAAEERLRDEIQRVDLEHEHQALARPLFADCATRYLFESRKKRSAAIIAWHDAPTPLITMQPESPRQPYPLTWEEQDRLFPLLPVHLGRMVLFAVNTGLRDSNVCKLQWTWEVPVPEIGRSVFLIPPEAFKSKRPYVVILNDAAWSIIEAQRGKHPIWVFPYRGKAIDTMNNTAWQTARRLAGLRAARIHDLRHTYGSRLRAAGVSDEDRAALLGHSCSSMPQLYASPDIRRLVPLANRVLERSSVVTIVRISGEGREERAPVIATEAARADESPKFGRVLAFRAPRKLEAMPAGSR